ncbi:hypothetical protein N7532_000931 [Penicillium argentinense]|uniref:histidine kinase n=1 Tax=Penicillium argentinense TaxID=1131581 RepID=A0A9W9G1I6_9EURO|nr:uncharacterized protein N7532_000931 [Penicillium argentinense]KAJ5110396.1 hypothetical protein N7532_000931 [Penicillium argentinense]
MALIIDPSERSPYRLAQEREFYRYHSPAVPSALHHGPSDRYIPREDCATHYAPWDHESSKAFRPFPSRNTALNCYAQIAATRLETERALISLFDRTHQYVLAEATPTMSLVGAHFANDAEYLQLGCCIFPKERGLCHNIEIASPSGQPDNHTVVDKYTTVILDVVQDERVRSEGLLVPLRDVRFYASVPLMSPRGLRIGALSVMDGKARTSFPDQVSMQFLKDMAATVMEHLTMKESTQQSRRGERMIVGLGSFVEGRTTLRDSWREAKAQHDAAENSGESVEGQLNMDQQDIQQLAKETKDAGQTGRKPSVMQVPVRSKAADQIGKMEEQKSTQRDSTTANRETRSPETRTGNQVSLPRQSAKRSQESSIEVSLKGDSFRSVLAGESLQDDTLPTSVRNIFSRASNLLRESIGAEGVMFLDANSKKFGSLVNQNTRRVADPTPTNGTSSDSGSAGSGSSTQQKNAEARRRSSAEGNQMVSECLGFSSSQVSSIDNEEKAGKAIAVPEPLFTSLIERYPRGKIFTYNADGSVSEDTDELTHSGSEPWPGRSSKTNADRSRWYAGVLAWTNEPDRIFTFENELVYISAFTNSIMAEIRRVDTEVAEKAKTNLVSSITHELRNPLHGILGTADILSDTAMNALQHGMVHTIESHDQQSAGLTFIDQYRKGNTSQPKKGKHGIPKSLPLGERTPSTRVELDSMLEEVTECVFAGYCFYNHPKAPPPALTESSSRSAGQPDQADPVGPRASQVTVIFDIEPETEWDFYTHAGAWRRVLMNIFGNALKYTSSGYIYLELKSAQEGTSSTDSPSNSNDFEVTLTVKDTGKGIGADYLQKDLFSPFSQEDPLASGSGLGLSIVRQAVGYLGGAIEIQSTKGVGTQLSIHAPLTKSPAVSDTNSSSRSIFSSLRHSTENKTIGFLGFGELHPIVSLERMCREWFTLEVTKVSPLEGKHKPLDFYLAVQTELDSEDVGGRDLFNLQQHLNKDGVWQAPVVVICQSPEEAHGMFVASKNRGDPTFFEFVSQPCGPRKLARALDICIQRQQEQECGQRASNEPTRWVEMPESSHLPVDVGPTDPPQDRMKINKRPTKDTIGSDKRERRSSRPSSPGDHHPEPSEADANSSAQSTAATTPNKTNPTTNSPSVLLVDDNDLNLQLLCAYTKKEGLEYVTGKNGAEAVELYQNRPGGFQVVIIDLSMPVMDGVEASRQIRRLENERRVTLPESEQETTPRTFIVALTGLDSTEAQKEALGSGIDTFLIKPINKQEMQGVFRRKP